MKETLWPASRIAKWSAIALVGFFVFCVAFAAGCREYNRYQKRADAKNDVKVTATRIQQAAQQVDVVEKEAEQRIEEAKGIRAAQEIINATLTPLYVQHEAIQAQEAMAHGENHTEIYIPSGNNGVPLVKPTTP